MHIIEIKALSNGAHRNQNGFIGDVLPVGWAVIPDSIKIPSTFPFVNITVSNGKVTSMTAGTVPNPEPVPDEPTQLDMIEAQVVYTAMMTDTLLGG